jgi:outer membrane biosynthesis protein TonB
MGERRRFATAAGFALVLCLTSLCGISYGQVEGGAIVAIEAPAGYKTPAAGGSSAGPAAAQGGSAQKSARGSKTLGGRRNSAGKSQTRSTPVARTVPRTNSPSKWDGFVVGDKYTFLNFEVISAAKPYYTREAKSGGAKGLVQVEILIGTDGRVLTARARTGNPMLHPEAERAALESRFNRPTVYGKPARAIGFLVYRFGPAED